MIPRRRRNPGNLVDSHLTPCLDDAVALSLQAKVAHWNVKGPSFVGLHELFDKIHAVAGGHADAIAERIVQLGGTTSAVAESVAKGTRLPRYPLGAAMGRDHAKAMTEALRVYSNGLQAAAAHADDIGDAATLDILSEAIRDADKQRWFVESHLRGDTKFNPPSDEQERERITSMIQADLDSAREAGRKKVGEHLMRVASEWHARHPRQKLKFSVDGFYSFGFFVNGVAVTDDEDNPELEPLVAATRWVIDELDPLGIEPESFEVLPGGRRSKR